MTDPAIFAPRDLNFKNPYGAVPSGTVVCFTLRPPRAGGFSRGRLTARFESRNNEEQIIPLPWVDSQLGVDQFRGTLDVGTYVGLIWYSFVLEGLDGRRAELGPYQLTVYQGEEAVPTWFGEGMTYQIFPDRFCRSRIPDPTGLVGGRTVHQDWEDEPVYRPDERGEIRNRDFFGGDFQGVISKLDDLKDLGVETLYFNPIFEAAENHRYGTADYDRIDPMLGCNEDFSRLCDEAHKRGMRVMLDGVFNHTGFVSRYFNGDGFYPDVGACQSWDSPYRSWFQFIRWPDQYESWWGIYSLPAVNESDPGYRRFIFGDEDSVVRRWLRAGADGWRLDVADELPDDFIAEIRSAMDQEKPDSFLLGEVWEDGSNKIAYSQRRRYLLGSETNGLMNYPFRTAALDWLRGGDAAVFRDTMEVIREHYPRPAFYSALNILGTHDTPRILTLLGAEDVPDTKDGRAAYRLSPAQRQKGQARLRVGEMLLYCFPGSPTVYYGDEAGMEGFEDPLNRGTYPWGREDQELLAFFRQLGQLRRERLSMQEGDLTYLHARGGVLVLRRQLGDEITVAALNAGEDAAEVAIPWPRELAREALTFQQFYAPGGKLRLRLPPVSGMILI